MISNHQSDWKMFSFTKKYIISKYWWDPNLGEIIRNFNARQSIIRWFQRIGRHKSEIKWATILAWIGVYSQKRIIQYRFRFNTLKLYPDKNCLLFFSNSMYIHKICEYIVYIHVAIRTLSLAKKNKFTKLSL